MATKFSRDRSMNSRQEKPDMKKRAENSWVMLLRDSVLESNDQICMVTLPHPGSGSPAKYCLAGRSILEVVVYDERNRSWFIGETVKSDGKLLITTPINPTFLILPRLIEECSNKAVPLEHLLSEKGFDRISDYITDLSHVADLKGPADIKAYKYNAQKAVAWLEDRVRRVASELRSKDMHVTAGAVSATFVTSSKEECDIDEEYFLKYAYGIVSQYLPESLADSLEQHFNFKPELIETLSKKRKSEAEENIDKKKVLKIESDKEYKENSITSPKQDVTSHNSKNLKPATLTNKEKARQKAASGTKTISSFFAKK